MSAALVLIDDANESRIVEYIDDDEGKRGWLAGHRPASERSRGCSLDGAPEAAMTRIRLFNTRGAAHGRAHAGFTLIELMVVVTIIAILASIALPSFMDHIRKGRRADAAAFLSDVVTRQQQFLLDRRAYATSITDAPSAGGLGLTVPANVASHYTLSMTTDNNPPPSFTLSAVPQGAQTAERCGSLTITGAGVKTASGTGSCW